MNVQASAQSSADVLNDERNLMSIETVQKLLNRSRASVYRYANTDVELINPPFDSKRLNPEIRINRDDPLRFHPNEVARFARDVLGIKQITIEVQQSPETTTDKTLKEILAELRLIRQMLQNQTPSGSDGQVK
ncbi:MAG: resolvase [Cyanobacteria bacterium P01_A01_bin.123]